VEDPCESFVIVVSAQKGGVGKTTTVINLSVAADKEAAGKIAVIDADPQNSLARWHGLRQADTPERFVFESQDYASGIAHLKRSGYKYIFVDTAAAHTTDMTYLYQLSDLVLIPLKASKLDVWSIGATVQVVKSIGKPLLFLLNMVKPNQKDGFAVASMLSHYGPVAHSTFNERVSYVRCIDKGLSAQELDPKGACAEEVTTVWEDVKNILHTKVGAHA